MSALAIPTLVAAAAALSAATFLGPRDARAGEPAALPVLMSPAWAAATCDAWNADPVLTDGLAESGWAANDAGRGYKVMYIYRSDCEDSARVELRIIQKDDKAWCEYGGAVVTEADYKVDYEMWAKTDRWTQMGDGEYGPMKGMLTGRLRFKGPEGEAMGNMGPFANFLVLVGAVDSSIDSCP